MISYEPLWKTMRQKGVTTYTLIYKYNINSRTISHLRHNKSVTMYTLEYLCEILDCKPNDVIAFYKAPESSPFLSYLK